LARQVLGDGACYEAAYQAAETALDLPQAVELVARVTGLVRSIRRETSDVFHFLPANCRRITRDEQDFLGALRTAIQAIMPPFPRRCLSGMESILPFGAISVDDRGE
jgi:hypothetical protein